MAGSRTAHMHAMAVCSEVFQQLLTRDMERSEARRGVLLSASSLDPREEAGAGKGSSREAGICSR